MVQPTASKTGLLLQCPRPFDPKLEAFRGAVGEPARYGSAFHGLMRDWISIKEPGLSNAKTAVDRWQLSTKPSALLKHVQGSHKLLFDWLKQKGLKEILAAERPMAYSLETECLREVVFDEETHHYELKDMEIGLTADLVVRLPDSIAVIDYKTGTHENYTDPLTPQMQTIACAYRAYYIAILHSPPLSITTIYEAEYDTYARSKHLSKLKRALELDHSFVRIGPECRYCHVRESCPARLGDLVHDTSSLVKEVYQAKSEAIFAPEIDRGKFLRMAHKLEVLMKEARATILEEVREGMLIEDEEGRAYRVVQAGRENISKKSILEALGPTKGQQEINRLQELGCFKLSEWEELRAK